MSIVSPGRPTVRSVVLRSSKYVRKGERIIHGHFVILRNRHVLNEVPCIRVVETFKQTSVGSDKQIVRIICPKCNKASMARIEERYKPLTPGTTQGGSKKPTDSLRPDVEVPSQVAKPSPGEYATASSGVNFVL